MNQTEDHAGVRCTKCGALHSSFNAKHHRCIAVDTSEIRKLADMLKTSGWDDAGDCSEKMRRVRTALLAIIDAPLLKEARAKLTPHELEALTRAAKAAK